VPPAKELSANPVKDLTKKNGLTLEGWEGKPKWGLTPIRTQAIDDYWHNSRLCEEHRRRPEGNA
jgi:hypothetical protein